MEKKEFYVTFKSIFLNQNQMLILERGGSPKTPLMFASFQVFIPRVLCFMIFFCKHLASLDGSSFSTQLYSCTQPRE